MNDNSSKTTLKDLEIAIKFLNKEITVKDVEDIYGNFNDPKFQSALSQVKDLYGDIGRAINLRNLVLLRNSELKFQSILNNAIVESEFQLAGLTQYRKELESHVNYELKKEVEAQRLNMLRYARMSVNDIFKEITASVPGVIKAMPGFTERYQQKAWDLKTGVTYRAWVLTQKDRLQELEHYDAAIIEVEGKINIQQAILSQGRINIARLNKQIYLNQLQTLVNVTQGMFQMVIDNIY